MKAARANTYFFTTQWLPMLPFVCSPLELTRELFFRGLTRKLLRVVGAIQDRHKQAMIDGKANGEWEFPVFPGSHLQLFGPVLEFVKFVCTILMLAKEFPDRGGLTSKKPSGVNRRSRVLE
jgi:hypothetical protein